MIIRNDESKFGIQTRDLAFILEFSESGEGLEIHVSEIIDGQEAGTWGHLDFSQREKLRQWLSLSLPDELKTPLPTDQPNESRTLPDLEFKLDFEYPSSRFYCRFSSECGDVAVFSYMQEKSREIIVSGEINGSDVFALIEWIDSFNRRGTRDG